MSTNHEHLACTHTGIAGVAYCPTCDVCYCKKCGKEWGGFIHSWYYTPTYTYPSIYPTYTTTTSCGTPAESPNPHKHS